MDAPENVDRAAWRRHLWRNRLQSLVLIGVMGAFLALLGALLWGPTGTAALLAVGALAISFNPARSARWVMRAQGASPITYAQAPPLWHAVEELAARAGLPAVPALYHLPSSALNAFTVGSRSRSAIALTDGLLRALEPRELVAVLAHEVSHVRNNDLWLMGLADLFTRTTSVLSTAGLFLLFLNLPLMLVGHVYVSWLAVALLVVAPNLSALAQLALTRTREYDADLGAVELTWDPDALASALLKISGTQRHWLHGLLLPGRRHPDPSLLRTHPETDQRVARLMELKPRLSRRPMPPPATLGFDHLRSFGAPAYGRARHRPAGFWRSLR